MYNLVEYLWSGQNKVSKKQRTLVTNQPYPICKARKTKEESNQSNRFYYKIEKVK